MSGDFEEREGEMYEKTGGEGKCERSKKKKLSEKYYAVEQESFEEEDYYDFSAEKTFIDCIQCPQ